MKPKRKIVHREACWVAAVYLVFGTLWILISDRVVMTLAGDDLALHEQLQNTKGLFFIGLSALVLYTGTVWALNTRERLRIEQQHLQDMLRVAQKLEGLGTMAASMAHDFNNVLSVIKLNAQTMAGDPLPADEIATMLREIEAAADRGQTAIKQLMMFMRNRPATVAPQDMATIVRNFEPLIQRAATQRVRIVTEVSDGLPAVTCDAAQIEQALLNLTTNARDAMDGARDKRITIRLYAETLRGYTSIFSPTRRDGDFVIIEVRDSGAGIPRENLAEIFSPFFTTKPEGKGTGLGLASIWRTMELHHGWVEVDSSPGNGARFRLFFPVEETARPAARAMPAATARKQAIRNLERQPLQPIG